MARHDVIQDIVNFIINDYLDKIMIIDDVEIENIIDDYFIEQIVVEVSDKLEDAGIEVT